MLQYNITVSHHVFLLQINGFLFIVPQFWRIATCFVYYPISPQTGFHYLLNLYFLYSYSTRLETGKGLSIVPLFNLKFFCCVLQFTFFVNLYIIFIFIIMTLNLRFWPSSTADHIHVIRVVKAFFMIDCWVKNPAIMICYCFKIKSVIYYKIKNIIVIGD